MYQLIALDMDGTLLNENKEISDRTHRAIKALKKRGKKVVLATGRPLNGVLPYLKELDLFAEDDYVITFNGALVQSTKNEEILLDMPLSVDAYVELYELSQKLGLHIHALTDRSVLTPKNNPFTEIESKINKIPIIESPVNSHTKEQLIVKVMFIDEPKLLDQAIPLIPDAIKDKYTIVRSAPYFLEFLDNRVNKGAGVAAVADKLGLTHENVICVGDAGNDLAMIDYAKLGVAMGNASKDVKEAANYITFTNEEDGVAYIIEQFML